MKDTNKITLKTPRLKQIINLPYAQKINFVLKKQKVVC